MLLANIPGDFYSPLASLPFQASGADQRRAAQQPQRPHLRANLDTRSKLGRTAAASDSTLVQPTPHTTASASAEEAEEPKGSGNPPVCLPSADKSHLSHPFLPNTEQYLAQGSYLNVDLTAQSKNRLVFL